MKKTNCNQGELIECGCELSFDSFVSPSLSVLSIGNLIGGNCILDEYVIDWYRNGVHEFVSGVGSDPDIEAYHPFLGLASIPVLPGEWVPIVRYIVIDGRQIFNEEKTCRDWCFWISNLPTVIVVNPLTCESVGGNPLEGYNYRIAYSSTQDYSLAYRKFALYLKDDLSIKYVALRFTGEEVPDQLDVYWNEETEPIFSIICGIVNPQFDTMPYRAGTFYTFVIPTDGYIVGDYLRFEVTPSVDYYNINTNWALDIKCLDLEFPCEYFTDEMRTITGINIVDATNSCRKDLQVEMAQTVSGISNTTHPLYLWSKYLGLYQSGTVVENKYVFNLQKLPRYSIGTFGSSGNYINTIGNINITKAGNVTTITFDNQEDYNYYYNGYTALTNTSFFTQYVNDPTNINYYRAIINPFRISENSCGDTYIPVNLVAHISSNFEFNSVDRIITITTSLMNNEIELIECTSNYSAAASVVSLCNIYHTMADYSYTTRCRNQYGFSQGYFLFLSPLSIDYYFGTMIFKQGGRGVPCTLNICSNSSSLNAHLLYCRIKYTGDPWWENYKIYPAMSNNWCTDPTNETVIYEVVNNNVVTNLLPYTP